MLLLASQSPRRAELLKQLNVPFTALSCDIDETCWPEEESYDYVVRLATEKAAAGWQRCVHQKYMAALGSDTSVVIGDTILGKPEDKDDFVRMMQRLSSKTHEVKTAVSVVNGSMQETLVVSTEVMFKTLSMNEIDWYWSTGEPIDKAGGYAIQGFGGQFVKRIVGSYSAVVGLPLYETAELLKKFGVVTYER
jgi:septum formation protein